MQDAAQAVVMTAVRNGGLSVPARGFLRRADKAGPCGRERRRARECKLQEQQAGDESRQHARKAALSPQRIHRRRLWFQSRRLETDS